MTRLASLQTLAVLILLGVVAPVASDARDWYVRSANTCAYHGDGTALACATAVGTAGAWRGLANVRWTSIRDGDTLWLAGGDTYTDSLNVGSSGSSWSTGQFITISVTGTNGGTWPAVIDNQNRANDAPIYLGGQAYIVVDGVYGNAVLGDLNYGLKIINSGTNSGCVQDFSGGPFRVFHVDCSASQQGSGDDWHAAVVVARTGETGWEFAFNWIHYAAGGSGRWHSSGMWINAGADGTSFTDVLIHHNRIDRMYHDGIKTTLNASVYDNDVSYIDGSGHSDSILTQSSRYVQIYNNYIHDNGDHSIYVDNIGPWGPYHTIRIFNNVVATATAPSSFGVVLHPEDSDLDDVIVANNTFYAIDSNVVRKGSGSRKITNLVVLNNIIGRSTTTYQVDFNSGDIDFAGPESFDYNVYMTGGHDGSYVVNNLIGCVGGAARACTLSQLRVLTPPREQHGQFADPSFISAAAQNFRLAAGDTIAKASGRNLFAVYPFLALDKDGAPRPSSGPWSIGAYQWTSDPAPAPPSFMRLAH